MISCWISGLAHSPSSASYLRKRITATLTCCGQPVGQVNDQYYYTTISRKILGKLATPHTSFLFLFNKRIGQRCNCRCPSYIPPLTRSTEYSGGLTTGKLKIPDDEVLAFASSNERVVLTLNRRDFKRLHRYVPSHAGIIVCTDDVDRSGLAKRINAAILAGEPLAGKLVSVVRPAR